jgi:hypothetical protein
MALWICTNCTAASAVGLARCPQCSGVEYTEDDDPMPHAHKNRPPTGLEDPPSEGVELEPVDGPAADQPEPADESAAPDELAPKRAWVGYLIEQGHDERYIKGLTKQELIDLANTRDASASAGEAAGTGIAADTA